MDGFLAHTRRHWRYPLVVLAACVACESSPATADQHSPSIYSQSAPAAPEQAAKIQSDQPIVLLATAPAEGGQPPAVTAQIVQPQEGHLPRRQPVRATLSDLEDEPEVSAAAPQTFHYPRTESSVAKTVSAPDLQTTGELPDGETATEAEGRQSSDLVEQPAGAGDSAAAHTAQRVCRVFTLLGLCDESLLAPGNPEPACPAAEDCEQLAVSEPSKAAETAVADNRYSDDTQVKPESTSPALSAAPPVQPQPNGPKPVMVDLVMINPIEQSLLQPAEDSTSPTSSLRFETSKFDQRPETSQGLASIDQLKSSDSHELTSPGATEQSTAGRSLASGPLAEQPAAEAVAAQPLVEQQTAPEPQHEDTFAADNALSSAQSLEPVAVQLVEQRFWLAPEPGPTSRRQTSGAAEPRVKPSTHPGQDVLPDALAGTTAAEPPVEALAPRHQRDRKLSAASQRLRESLRTQEQPASDQLTMPSTVEQLAEASAMVKAPVAVEQQAGEPDQEKENQGDKPVQLAKFQPISAGGETGPPAGPMATPAPPRVELAGRMQCEVRRSQLMRVPYDVQRVAIGDPMICEVVRFAPREFSIIGRSQGTTKLTLWFHGQDNPPVTYEVQVGPDSDELRQVQEQYVKLSSLVAELYPQSEVQLLPEAGKLVVLGRAADAQQAREILALIRRARPIPVVDQLVIE